MNNRACQKLKNDKLNYFFLSILKKKKKKKKKLKEIKMFSNLIKI